MTFSINSVKTERICSLPEVIWIEDREHFPAIMSVALQSSTFWVLGRQVLLRSQDGINWQNVTANLRREGSFLVSSVLQEEADLRIFSRSRSGMRCYRWNEWDSAWEVLFSVSIASPGLFATWTESGLVMVAKDNPETEVICRESDTEDRPRWCCILPGSAIHIQISPSGIGLCALWGINRSPSNCDSSPSAIYSTNDNGQNWRMVAKMETMLLAGASHDQDTALIGGTGGVLGLVDKGGLQELWEEDGGDIVAVDTDGSQQIAIIESDHEPAIHRFLFREGSGKWTQYMARFDDRVQCIKLVALGECIVCTRQVIYRCQFK